MNKDTAAFFRHYIQCEGYPFLVISYLQSQRLSCAVDKGVSIKEL
jgi:hypothetical protein